MRASLLRRVVICLLPALPLACAAAPTASTMIVPGAPTASTSVAPPASASASASAASRPPRDACEALRANPAFVRAGDLFGCRLLPAGAWAVAVRPPVEGAKEFVASALHVDGLGTVARYDRAIPDDHGEFGNLGNPDLAPPPASPADPPAQAPDATILDFDGDGAPELVVDLAYSGYERTRVAQLFVTFKGGAVAPYAGATGLVFSRFEDFDADGLMDGEVEYALGVHKGCDWCAASEVQAKYRAHALPGGAFSLTDAVATAPLRASCPKRPATFLSLEHGGFVDTSALLCARARGESGASVLARLKAMCAPYAARSAKCEGPCRDEAIGALYARFEPPVKL